MKLTHPEYIAKMAPCLEYGNLVMMATTAEVEATMPGFNDEYRQALRDAATALRRLSKFH